jgi:transposase
MANKTLERNAMATVDYWAEDPLDRDRARIYSPTLDSNLSQDDPVRLVDEVLGQIDWSSWEAEYKHQRRGQPPIHPRIIAAAILYGMYRGIRSSRKLEEACCYRLDFIWLVRGFRIDHTTFNKFRTKFKQPLKDLFRQIGRIAMTLGLIRLGEVAFDGTRVKANNSRYHTLTAKTLEEKLAALDKVFEGLLQDTEAADARQAGDGSPTHLPDDLADLEERRARIQQALEKAQAADEARRKNGIDPAKNPAQIPTTDPDSKVMPNKEGGYAPNYTPVVTTDGERGFILDVDVLAEVNETPALTEALDRIEETFGQQPDKVLTDGGNNSGQVMAEMEKRDIEFYAPAQSNQPTAGSPAHRDDPTQPVPAAAVPELPRNPQGQLDKSNFIYDKDQDQYHCPQGHAMPFDDSKPAKRGEVRVDRKVYRCEACAGCPLASACVSPKSKGGRTITRDEYEEVRERTAARMSSPEGRQRYKQRPRIAETPFGILKAIMGIRQFLLRGLDKVKTEWLWAATAFNVMKLAREIGKLRAAGTEMATAV